MTICYPDVPDLSYRVNRKLKRRRIKGVAEYLHPDLEVHVPLWTDAKLITAIVTKAEAEMANFDING